jgi:hypothetical protein
VEDPLHHCITADDAYISIAANNLCGGEQYEGRWIPKEGLELNRDAAPRPHFTRIQPQDCRYPNPEFYTDRCMVPLNNEHLEDDSFDWNQDQTWVAQIKRFQLDVDSEVIHEYRASGQH